MSVGRMAALPMYDFPNVVDAHDALWTEIAKRLRDAGVEGVPASLTRDLDFVASWRHPSLLLGQACEFPLAKFHADDVRLVATPRYTAEGCEGFRYRSLIVVRRGDPVRSLADLR